MYLSSVERNSLRVKYFKSTDIEGLIDSTEEYVLDLVKKNRQQYEIHYYKLSESNEWILMHSISMV